MTQLLFFPTHIIWIHLLAFFKKQPQERKVLKPLMKHFSHQSKGKWKHKGNSNKKPNPRPANNSAHKKLPCHYCGYKGQIQPGCWKKRRDNAKILLPKVSLHPTQTQPISQKNNFLWHWRYASHLVRPPTSIIDEWLVDNSAIVHMTYHISILHDVPSPFRTFFRFGWTNYLNHWWVARRQWRYCTQDI